MLDSLSVKNYRNLKDLRIESLERVNLIVGKNNTGKSSLLEAVSIYASKANTSWIYELLKTRGEYDINLINNYPHNKLSYENYRHILSLLYNRRIDFSREFKITISVVEESLNSFEKNNSFVSIGLVKYIDEAFQQTDENGIVSTQYRTKIIEGSEELTNFQVGIEINNNGNVYIQSDIPTPYFYDSFNNLSLSIRNTNFQFIKSNQIDWEENSKLWDIVALTPKEEYIIEALKIIEPSISRIAFIGNNNDVYTINRSPVVRFSNSNAVMPLKSMGDGINRILTIILALVNSTDGFLLIDEFENGLHHSVQEQLWKIIFKLSKDLNIQVFATTHSEDCIRSFTNILNESENTNDGKLIRLENKNGQIRQVEFTASELQIATNNDIEVR